MSEGRLAPVREADRHAALIAGLAAALFSGGTYYLLHSAGVQSTLIDVGKTASFAVSLVGAAAFGLVIGCTEGAIASRAARTAAQRFLPLQAFTFQVFIATSIANVVLVTAATFVAYTGVDIAAALFVAVLTSLAASALGSAFLGWSHAVDWPQIPDHMKVSQASGVPSQRAIEPPKVTALTLSPAPDDPYAPRNPVLDEPRRRRSDRPVNDEELWHQVQDLITRK